MIALAIAAQALDLMTWLAWVGPEIEGNPAMAMLSLEYVVVAKVIGIAVVVGICYKRHLRLPIIVAAFVGLIGAASNTMAAL